jgi:glycosyltransferase involved in cell wall biosynthesis
VQWWEPRLVGRAERFNSLLKPSYPLFHARAVRWMRQARARGERFDVAHQPVPVGMRYPSPLAGSGLPYLIGPVGGSLTSPPGFAEEDMSAAPWYMGLRQVDRWRVAHDPWLRRTYRDAACVLGIADYVRDFLAPIPLQRFEVLSETGIDSLAPPVDRCGRSGTVRLLFVGRLVRTKGAREAVRALSLVRDLPVHLDVVGEGFDRPECEALARELGVSDLVTFHGWQDRAQVQQHYRDADIFVFPSYREPGGNVAFEAMSNGLPLVVVDRGGPGAAVDDSCGFRLSADSPEQLAAGVADAVRVLVSDRALRLGMGEAARTRVCEIGLWPAKVDRMSALYDEVAAGGLVS